MVQSTKVFGRGVVAVVGIAAMTVAGCSSSGSSSSGESGTTTQGAAAQTNASSGGVDLDKLAKAVDEAAALPSFKDYAAGYGGKVTNTASLRGKKLMIVPGNSQLAACTEIAQADAVLARAVGMKTKIFANDGTTTQHNSAIEEAIHQHYDAINLECDFDPTTTAPAIAQAQKAGIKVIAYGATEQETKDSKIDADTVDPYALDAKIAADQAVVQHKGEPFHAIAITSNEAPATRIMQDSLKAELGRICPKCTVTDVNVPVANWTTDVASSLASALLRNKDVDVIFPDYAGMLTYVLKGLQTAHRSDIKAYLAFGGGTPFIKLQTVEPGKSIIQSDIGGYPPWTGYLLFLQTARVLTGMTPIPLDKAIGPNRVATPENAVEVLTTGGWGKDWVNGFRDLLGLPALSGQALTKASTLNGAMTDKPGK